MTLSEIKQAVREGKTVHWGNENYEVVTDKLAQWFIRCKLNNNYVGLTWRDGETMNGKPEQFFIK